MMTRNPPPFGARILRTILCSAVCLSGTGVMRGADTPDGGPAFQPAISRAEIEADWMVQAKLRFAPPSSAAAADVDWPVVLQQTLQRARMLADALQVLQVPVESDRLTLQRVAQQVATYGPTTTTDAWQQTFREARWAVRHMLLNHPLLDFDSILLVKRAPTQFPHLSDQYYGWWSRPGGGVYMLRNFARKLRRSAV